MLPPVAITADINDSNQSSEYSTKKPELNSSLMPMISYNPDQYIQEQAHVPREKSMGRRMSQMDIMAAITQLAPDVEAGPTTPGVDGGRKEMYDSVL